MALLRPHSLTVSQSNNPHRTARVGKMSMLEYSFHHGNIDEMQWWIQEGVVVEAMSGKARSRRPYNVSLMHHLSRHLNYWGQHLDDEKRSSINEILETLWVLGADKATDHHNTWLRRLSGWAIADRLLDAGANPWIEKSDELGVVRKKTEDYEAPNAIHSAMDILEIQHLRPDFQEKTFNDLIAPLQYRIDRMLRSHFKPEHNAWHVVLEKIVKSGLRCETYATFDERTPATEKARNAFSLRWRQWFDQLMEMQEEGFSLQIPKLLYAISETAPRTPLNKTEISLRLYQEAHALRLAKCKEQKNSEWWNEPLPTLDDSRIETILRETTQSRTDYWLRSTNHWMDVIEKQLASQKTTQATPLHPYETYTTILFLRNMLDAPNGVSIIERGTQQLRSQGYSLPWFFKKNARMGEAFNMQNFIGKSNSERSLRKLTMIGTLIQNTTLPTEIVSPIWTGRLAKEYLELSHSSDAEHTPPPGSTFMITTPPMRLFFNPVEYAKSPSAAELEHLLKICTLALHNTDSGDAIEQSDHPLQWTIELMKRLPTQWSKEGTSIEEQQTLLILLSKYGVLKALLSQPTSFSDAAIEHWDFYQSSAASMTYEKLRSDWFDSWRDPPFSKLLKTTVDLHGDDETRRVLTRLYAFQGLHENAPPSTDGSQDEYIAFLSEALDDATHQSPKTLDFLALSLCQKLGKYDDTYKPGIFQTRLDSLNKLIDKGWIPQPTMDVVGQILSGIVKTIPDETTISKTIATVMRTGQKNEVSTKVVETLLLHERFIGPDPEHVAAWAPVLEKMFTLGATPNLESFKDPSEGSLTFLAKRAAIRKQLAEIATPRESEPLQTTRPNKPRF